MLLMMWGWVRCLDKPEGKRNRKDQHKDENGE
jgi:hypothetical protein